ncbi:mitochondrial coiled-coil domain protein 1 [Trichosurus vulpecula]|uniref:mitochondrial coiled-coil domain protein 1 n=1 Tax=Trichosurus vulpecula TaxID=9337 RepID=UPI00186B29A9|nr:mitochondrial coiled-coil domain protein 1 [Trichosurus vulpecula]
MKKPERADLGVKPQPAMGLPLPWLSRCCCRLLPSWIMAPHTSRGAYCQNAGPPTGELATEETRKTLSPNRGPGHRRAELAQAEELLEQQLELYQALLEGQEGAWEAQALVLKIQKLKEQMRRHRESLKGDA